MTSLQRRCSSDDMFSGVPCDSCHKVAADDLPSSQESEGYFSYGTPQSEGENGIPITRAEEPVAEDFSFDYTALHSPIQHKTIEQLIEDSSRPWPYADKNLWEVLPVIPKRKSALEDCLKPGSLFSSGDSDSSFDSFFDSPFGEQRMEEVSEKEEEEILAPRMQFEFDPFTEGDKYDW
ncbi:hypothetical protein QR680_010794 [Steinernema hermaphroditum]|uniref:Uncharacterized protein n=1 Tax=Steinernema hermaphroditum TaxID=289476 RepID=A0AA39MCE1_9BILA|nr:hypothetical protein QR680_010794 [Steinernema hermaphroditum]